MIMFIILFCVALGTFSSMGLGPWESFFASLGAMAVLGTLFNIILAFLFRND